MFATTMVPFNNLLTKLRKLFKGGNYSENSTEGNTNENLLFSKINKMRA